MNTGSVEGGTGWYSVVLGQNRAVLFASMICFQKIYGLHGVNHQIIQYSEHSTWYLVVLGQNRAILVASMLSFQKIYGLHGLSRQIIEYSKKEKVMTDTDRQTEFPLVDSTPSVERVD